jgi:hypothetical protein
MRTPRHSDAYFIPNIKLRIESVGIVEPVANCRFVRCGDVHRAAHDLSFGTVFEESGTREPANLNSSPTLAISIELLNVYCVWDL